MKIIGKQKEGTNMCSHFFFFFFWALFNKHHTGFWKIAFLFLLTKPMDLIPLEEKNTRRRVLEKSTENCYSIWIEHDRLIVLFGQITLSNTYLWHILLAVFVVYVFRFHILQFYYFWSFIYITIIQWCYCSPLYPVSI